ncbi:pectate lyase family protein [Pseudotamlana carrageenivorans]|uniref:Pectate lyase n=1 Tax=Pseudotamlana carrageenivorans TaxID=2069432 RepID=A0A2I7SMD2_9FLAO|nr:pectate lyase [Tamlana carrageenivorans]AUS07047.1 pectate lyase [Tamlana carrageenivorans]
MKKIHVLIVIILIFAYNCSSSTVEDEKEEKVEEVTPEPQPEPEEEQPTAVQEEAFAFPSAEGFGKYTTGGRGGKVIFVTNLNDSGAGSFRTAVNTSGKRYILFKVSGTIALKSPIKITNNDLTIAGQTAPGDGICIKDYPVVINADNVIIRYLRFRMGDAAAQQADALESRFHKNIVIDHCSLSWSSDETATFYNNENTTFQWCFVTESLKTSVHEKGSHGYGGIWGGKNASFHHNLIAHHDSRNPRLGEYAGSSFALTDLVDLRNNVIYNWGGNSCYGGEAMNVNIVNCYYKPGPATKKKTRIIAIDKNKNEGTEVYDIWGKFYIDGNLMEGSSNVTNDNWTYGVYNQFHGSYGTVSEEDKANMKLNTPHDIENNVQTDSAEEAYEKVLAHGGASLVRDSVDERIVNEVKNGTYTFEGSKGSTSGIIDSQADVGGWPELKSTEAPVDSSGDGMPDSWKKEMKLDVTKNNPNGHELSTGYENIEVYINSLVD